MKKVLVISPHFDDAVLSVGQYMADRADCEVATVFAGMPITPDYKKTPYDEKCGFKNARDAVGERTMENDRALALLEATSINLDFPDGQYENPVNVLDIAIKLQEILDKEDYEFILAPMGLGHPDHLMTTNAVIQLKTELPIFLWEDIPLRIVEPELVWDRVTELKLSRDMLKTPATTGNKMAKKIRAMLCYKSQINTGILDPFVMYVPERLWKYQ